MTTFKLECSNCNAMLDLDMDNLIAYCPYCGNKILIDVEQLGELLTEREKTRREEERTRQHSILLEKTRVERESKERIERRKNIVSFLKSDNGSALAIFGALIVGFLLFILIVSIFC